jgi:hypothetical protein
LLDWYGRNRLKEDFSLRALVSDAIAEEMDGFFVPNREEASLDRTSDRNASRARSPKP